MELNRKVGFLKKNFSGVVKNVPTPAPNLRRLEAKRSMFENDGGKIF